MGFWGCELRVGNHNSTAKAPFRHSNFGEGIVKLVDGFLVSTGLLIFALGLFEIFIHPLDLPDALRFTTVGQLKASLANIIVLTLAVTFLASVQNGGDPQTILFQGIGIAIVAAVLVLFARSGEQDSH
jgi:uncharacterized membrane protein YqhA